MTVRDILKMGDPRLLRIAMPVPAADFDSDALHLLVADMFDTMAAEGGVGLAAPQIGVGLRVVIFGFEHSQRYPDAPPVPMTILVNPVITPLCEDKAPYDEGCLSVPGFYETVERPARVRINALDGDGKAFEETAEGLLAVCIQHEMDHLNGKLFVDYLSALKRDRIKKKLEKQHKQQA